MNLDELQSVQARERQSSDLQHLRSSFYREVGEYIQDLTAQRDELVEDAEDPFSVPAVRQLTDDIETAEQTIEAIYERRVGKVVKKASIAAAGMPVGDEGLTAEESELFDDLVARIEENRETVLSVLDGGSSAGTYSLRDEDGSSRSGTDRESGVDAPNDGEDDGSAATEGVSAADLMGAEDPDEADDAENESSDDSSPTEIPPEPGPPGAPPEETGTSSDDADDSGGPASDGPDASAKPGGSDENESADQSVAAVGSDETDETGGSDEESGIPGLPRTTVRITADVGEVVGADDRDYDLRREDVVTLPEPNAEVLVDNDAAERLE